LWIFDSSQRDDGALTDRHGPIFQDGDQRFYGTFIAQGAQGLGRITPNPPIGVLQIGQKSIDGARVTALSQESGGIAAPRPI
jgi:hypothetical protein